MLHKLAPEAAVMSRGQEPCEPLPFEEVFLKLIADMDGTIHRAAPGSDARKKLIRYQTLMVNGGYLGLRAKELLHLTWFDIVSKTESTVFQFKTGNKRKVYFAPTQIQYNERNFRLLDPVNVHHLVLHKLDAPMAPVATGQFNQALRVYFRKFRVKTCTPSSHTLRKTHMQYLFEKLSEQYSADRAYITVTKAMGYRTVQQAMDYLCHTQRQIKETVVKFK